MEFLYRRATPAYKGSQAQPTRTTGLLSELGSVIGSNAAPAYKTRDGSVQAPVPSRSWLRALAVTPSYKTAAPCEADRVDPCPSSPDEGDGDADHARECDDSPLQVVIL